MTDLNTAIVKYKGWKHNPDGFDLGLGNDVNFKYQSPDGKLQSKLPDFEHDARLYMSLFEEMPDECFIQKINNRLYGVGKIEGIGVKTFSRNSNLGTAICQAYVKLKGIEVVG